MALLLVLRRFVVENVNLDTCRGRVKGRSLVMKEGGGGERLNSSSALIFIEAKMIFLDYSSSIDNKLISTFLFRLIPLEKFQLN